MVTAVKFTISDHPQPIDPLLKNCIGEWRRQILGKVRFCHGTVTSVTKTSTVNLLITEEVKCTKVIVPLQRSFIRYGFTG